MELQTRMVQLVRNMGQTADEIAAFLTRAKSVGVVGPEFAGHNALCLALVRYFGVRFSIQQDSLSAIGAGGNFLATMRTTGELRRFIQMHRVGHWPHLHLSDKELYIRSPWADQDSARRIPAGPEGIGWALHGKQTSIVVEGETRALFSRQCRKLAQRKDCRLFFEGGTWAALAWEVREIRRILLGYSSFIKGIRPGQERGVILATLNGSSQGRGYLESLGLKVWPKEWVVEVAPGAERGIVQVRAADDFGWRSVSEASYAMACRLAQDQGRQPSLLEMEMILPGTKDDDCDPFA